MGEPRPHPLNICDACGRRLAPELWAVVCEWHWHHLCAACQRLLMRPPQDQREAARPSAHHGYDRALRAPFVWCTFSRDDWPIGTEELVALRALEGSPR